MSKRLRLGEQQQRVFLREEFDRWRDVAERATNQFAHRLFALTCWRNLVSHRRGGARRAASGDSGTCCDADGEVGPRAETGFRRLLPGNEAGDEDGRSESVESGHNEPSSGEDDLPGMSDPEESDGQPAEKGDRSWILALDEAVRRRKMQESAHHSAQRVELSVHTTHALLCQQSVEEQRFGDRRRSGKRSLTATLSALLEEEEERARGRGASSPTAPRRAEGARSAIGEQKRWQPEPKRSEHLDLDSLTTHLEATGRERGRGREPGNCLQLAKPFEATPVDHELHLSQHHLQLSSPTPEAKCRKWVQSGEGARHAHRMGATGGLGYVGGHAGATSDSRGPSSLSARSTEASDTKRYPPWGRYNTLECARESPPPGIRESVEHSSAANAFGGEDEEGGKWEGMMALDEFVSSLARLRRA